MSKRRERMIYALTPQQSAASNILLEMAHRNMGAKYPGSFKVDLGDYDAGLKRLGLDSEMINELAKTGFATDTTPLTQATRAVGQEQAARAYETALARASEAGGTYGSAARAAAARAATSEVGKYELGVLQQVLAAQEAAAQRRVQGVQLASQVAETAASLGLDAAKLKLAAAQLEHGMEYEEWKRQNPDTLTLLSTLFGRNVDALVSQGPDRWGQFIKAIGTIIGAFVAKSDARLKKNIRDIGFSGLEIIRELRPVSYEWVRKEDGTEVEYGFIAQEVEKVFPEAVITKDDAKHINFWHLLVLLVMAVQELDDAQEHMWRSYHGHNCCEGR